MAYHTFRIIIEPDTPRGYHGFVPLLKGLHIYGHTIEEVKRHLREAIRCHIQGMIKDRQPIPKEEETFEFIQSFSGKELVASRR